MLESDCTRQNYGFIMYTQVGKVVHQEQHRRFAQGLVAVEKRSWQTPICVTVTANKLANLPIGPNCNRSKQPNRSVGYS